MLIIVWGVQPRAEHNSGQMLFVKLGGSLITDKTRNETARPEVLARLAGELQASVANLQAPILIGHGSGSFGHMAAKQYGTRAGVRTADEWRGFAHVSVAAARLNRLVADALHHAGLMVISLAPSASVQCTDGRIVSMDTRPIHQALQHGLCPLVMGDVGWDSARGGTIVSTEEVFAFLAGELPVSRVLLAGETEGVLEGFREDSGAESGERGAKGVIPRITAENWVALQSAIGGSRGADVTGGMASKVRDMLALVYAHPNLSVSIFSGLVPGNLARAIAGEQLGTAIGAGMKHEA